MTSYSFPTTAAVIGQLAAEGLARMAASAVSLFRLVVQLPLSDAECESRGLPYESTEGAVTATPLQGMPWWRVDVWIDRDPREHHLCFDLLGHRAEVSYLPRAEVSDDR